MNEVRTVTDSGARTIKRKGSVAMFKFIDLVSKVTVVTPPEKMTAAQKRVVNRIGGHK